MLLFCILGFILFHETYGHGRLLEPPSRSSLWRFYKDAPINYNDNELYCGGFFVQYETHGGKCGVCGDSYGDGENGKNPRPHEAGGKYGRGFISKKYKQGQEINVVIELTKNHRGHFEFKLCPTNDPLKRATEKCLDTFRLPMADGSGLKFPITTARNGFYDIKLRLPPHLTCSHCVLQWRYRNGNNWGICPDGVGRLGCGNQEEFRGCSDISILPSTTPIKPGVKPTAGNIPLRLTIPENDNEITACAPIIISSTEKRFEETLKWCQEMCVTKKPHSVCSKLCHCE